MFGHMDKRNRSWEQWQGILWEIEARHEAWSDVDPTTVPTEELLERLGQRLRDSEMIELFRQECIGELAERQIREWLDSVPAIPDWFAVRSAEFARGAG